MTVAELFAELDLKITGSTAGELKAFETTLQGIANAARNAALALKILARTKLPAGLGRVASPAAAGPAVAPGAVYGPPTAQQVARAGAAWGAPPILPAPRPGMLAFIGPMQPITPPPKPNNAVMQGLKALGLFGAKILGIATIAVAIKKLASALTEMVRASLQATFATDKVTAQTGVNRRELLKWEHVGALGDMKPGDIQDTFKRLRQQSEVIRFTGEGVTPYQIVGVNPNQSPDNVLKQFFERTKSMDQARAVYFGSQMGISDDLIYSYRKYGDRLNQVDPNAQLSDKEQANVMGLNAAWQDMTFQIGVLSRKLTSDLAPALTAVIEIIDGVSRFLASSKAARFEGAMALANPTSFGMNLLADYGLHRMFPGHHTTTVHNDVDVNIHDSKNPQATGKAAANAVGKVVGNSYYQRPDPTQNR